MPFPLQDADAKLTLTRIATAPVLIAEIAQATGRRLEVSPLLGTEVLVVSVEDTRVGDVLAKLAIAATATWQPMEGGYRLVPDAEARSVEASTERARRVQAITEGVKKRLAKAADPKANGLGALGANRSIDALVPMLDVKALAAMDEGDRLVFATSPTATQRSLNGDPNAVVAGLIAQHNEQAKAMAGQMDAMPEALSGLMSGPLGERFKRMTKPVTGPPAKIMVVASRGGLPFIGGGNGLDIRLEARVYGADGKVLVEETGTLDADMMTRIMAMTDKKSPTTAEKSTPIVYSPEAKALAATSAMPSMAMGMNSATFSMGDTAKSAMTPALRSLLLAPEKNDPLALLPGEGLVALAKARRKPLVALIPDEAFPTVFGTPAAKTVEDVEKGLEAGPMRLVPDTAFLVMKPSDPDSARKNRLDRRALGKLVRAANEHGVPTLAELSEFASRTPDPTQNRLSQAELSLFAPSAIGSMSGMTSWSALRLYASLAPSQRVGLQGGGRVAFGDLAPEASAALRTMLYGAGEHLSAEGASDDNDPVSLGLRMALGGGALDATEEPTEVAPNGLPAGGYLQATVSQQGIVRPIGVDGPGTSILGPDELAMTRLMAASPMASQMGDAMKLPDTGLLGTRKAWQIRGYVGKATYLSANLEDDSSPKDGTVVRLADLPASLQDQVARRADQLKKSPLGAILSMDPSAFGAPKAKP